MIKTRPLKAEDIDDVRIVDEATQIQYLGNVWAKLTEKEKDLYLESRKSEFKINVETGYSFVAVHDNIIVGFIFAHEMLPFHGTLYVRHIAIQPDFQGQGVGELLYKAVISKAKESGLRKIIALINLDNPNSMKMHEKLGFILNDRKEASLEL